MIDQNNKINWPPQRLSYRSKGKKWRKQHIDWAKTKTMFNYSLVQKSIIHKKINYDLLNGKLHMKDLQRVLNPQDIHTAYLPDEIQHYPVMNTKLDVLKGEEWARPFDFKVVCTNPNAVSSIEQNKKKAMFERLQTWVQTNFKSEEEASAELDRINDYFLYNWQDMRELRANRLVNHYKKELNFKITFNDGFSDAMAVSEEMYQCDIIGGEPTLERLDPNKVRIFKSGYSNKVEDADMILIEDYWSPGKVIDTFYDSLTEADRKYIEKMPDHVGQASVDSMDNIDERMGFINYNMIGDEITSQQGFFWDPMNMCEGVNNSMLPYDIAGNIRVLRLYWKSQRKIKKVKSYDPETGNVVYNIYSEDYICDKNAGEEEETYWVNEAWEGTLIGDEIYINIRKRPVQYNRLSNPSRCHFGIVGTIYNLNNMKPYSLVDRMKPLAYLYDVIHYRLNLILARNWGNMVRLDLSKKPKGWEVDKWVHYMRAMGLMIEDSFNEGSQGAAKGKIAGGLNTNSTGVVQASDSQSIQYYTMLLDYIKMELGDMIGMAKQREGQISNRETVGGVERATLQSSHITEWLFIKHDDTKRRAIECFIETAKAALQGHNKKFEYLLDDGSSMIMDIDGDEFAENDYGLVTDDSNDIHNLESKFDMLAQAALQNQTLSFGAIMKLYTASSVTEKQRYIEADEKKRQEQAQQQQQQEMQLQQQAIQQKQAAIEQQMAFQDQINQRDNETKILVAQINGEAEAQRFAMMNDDNGEQEYTEKDKADLAERIRQFDASLKMQEKELQFKKDKQKQDAELKLKQINKPTASSKSK